MRISVTISSILFPVRRAKTLSENNFESSTIECVMTTSTAEAEPTTRVEKFNCFYRVEHFPGAERAKNGENFRWKLNEMPERRESSTC